MSRVKLTAGRVRDFSCETGKSQSFLWDTESPGLAIRATQSNKAYIFQGKLSGRTIRITIGDVQTWPIESGSADQHGARTEARRLQALIDQSIDPRESKAKAVADAKEHRARAEQKKRRAEITVSDTWAAYTTARRPKWSARHYADHLSIATIGGMPARKGCRLIEPGALASLMTLRLAEIDAERVKAWLRDEAARRPTRAALAFRLLRAFLNWCGDTPDYRGIAGVDACRTRIAKDQLPKKNAKRDCLQREQLPAWFAAVRQIQNPVIAAYLQTLLLVGSRREELAWLKWDDVDFRWKSITIHDKVEGERVIPLTPFVASLLAALPRRNQWVFSSPTAESGRLQEPRINHNKACTIAGIENMTLHGLRRSFASLTEWLECPAGVVAQLMGHKPSATAERHYKVRPLDLLRMWHTKIEAWILEQAGIEQPAADAKAGLKVV